MNDRHLDEYLKLHPDCQEEAIAWLSSECSSVERRKRRRRPADQRAHEHALCVLAANALASESAKRPIAFSRRHDPKDRKTYKPDWLGAKSFNKTMDLAVDAGLIETTKGQWSWVTEKGRRSTFSPTQRFLDKAQELKLTTLHDAAAAPVVIIKDQAGNLSTLDPNDPNHMRAERLLRPYNQFLRGADLGLGISVDEWRDIYGQGDSRSYPDLGQTWLTRHFSQSDYEQCGRYYGGWWQTIPSGARSRILIDGQPTVEWDFASFIGTAAYIVLGREPPEGPYDLAEVYEAAKLEELSAAAVRKSLKTLFIAMVYCGSKKVPWRQKGLTLPKKYGQRLVCDLIRQRHAEIADRLFMQGLGMRIMFIESQICTRILERALSEGVVVLPIFDSFRVREDKSEWLQQVMNESYVISLNRLPHLKVA